MKCSKLSKLKSELFYKAFIQFKQNCLSKSVDSFNLNTIINFINENDFDIIAYDWHKDEKWLENENWGKTAISIHTALQCYSNSTINLFITDSQNNKVVLLKNNGNKSYSFI